MRRRPYATVALAVALLATGCDRASPAPQACAAAPSSRAQTRARPTTNARPTWWHDDASEGPTGFAILPAGTPLYSLPDTRSPSWPLPARDPVPGHWRLPGPARGVVVEVIGERDGMLEVQTRIDRAHGVHCEADLTDLTDLGPLQLRLWVPREAPSWVTTRAVRHVADDGSTVNLPPGVPLRRSDRDPSGRSWIAAALGVHVELTLPRDAVGRRYAQPATPQRPKEARYLGAEASLTFDGEPIAGRSRLDGQGQSIYGDRFDARGRLVTVGNACITLQARTDRRNRARPPTLAERSTLTSTAEPFRPYRPAPTETVTVPDYGARFARPGTIVYWRDGRVAGHVAALHAVGSGDEARVGKTCFAHALGASSEPMHLCMRTEDLAAHSQLGPPWADRVHVDDGTARQPTVTVAMLRSTVGALDESQTRRHLEERLGHARLCYLPRLALDPTIQGRLDLRVAVDGTGRVTSTTIDLNTTGDDALGDCMATVARAWPFPAPTDGAAAAVVVPLMLAPP